jgi:4-hydroxybenzoate polyprenyltransferase
MKRLLARTRVFEIGQIAFIAWVGVLFAAPVSETIYLLWLAAIGCQIACAYYLNDFFDWMADADNPRKPTPLPRAALGHLIIATAALSILLASAVGPVAIMFVTISHMAGILYSCPPFRWKEVKGAPLAGHAFMGFIYSLSSTMLGHSTATMVDIMWALFWAAVLASASLSNEVVDADTDRRAGIVTLGNTWPTTHTRWVLLALHLSALAALGILHIVLGSYITVAAGALGALMLTIVFITPHWYGSPLRYRLTYRIIFAAIMLVTVAERATYLLGTTDAT